LRVELGYKYETIMLPKETKLTKTDNKTGDHGLGLKMDGKYS